MFQLKHVIVHHVTGISQNNTAKHMTKNKRDESNLVAFAKCHQKDT